MAWIGGMAAAAITTRVLCDAFESVILPRRVRHPFRLARLFYQSTWWLWRTTALLLPAGRWRHGLLSVYGPLSLFGLLPVFR